MKAKSDEMIWTTKPEHFQLPDFDKPDWYQTCQPVSSLYRLFDINVNYFGLKTLVERMVLSAQYKGTFQLIRQLVTHCDGFYGWTMEQVVERETETQGKLLEKIHTPFSDEERDHL